MNRIHIVGFARGGTTLMRNLFLCFKDTYVHEQDVFYHDFDGIPKETNVVTKAPGDVRRITEFWEQGDEFQAVVLIRDPRDVITSRINRNSKGLPHHYGFAWDKFSTILTSINKIKTSGHSFFMVKYEEVVNNPAGVQKEIAQFCNLEIDVPFEDGWKRFPVETESNGQHQLNGIRPIDTKSIGRHKEPEYQDEVNRLLLEGGDLLQNFLRDWGYEELTE